MVSAVAYVDASAIVKLVLDEPDSAAMHRWYAESDRVVTSRIGILETERVARRATHDPTHLAFIVRAFEVFEFDEDIARRAALIDPASLRTLDAIHLATSLALERVDGFVTYDDRLAAAARDLGLPVVRPA